MQVQQKWVVNDINGSSFGCNQNFTSINCFLFLNLELCWFPSWSTHHSKSKSTKKNKTSTLFFWYQYLSYILQNIWHEERGPHRLMLLLPIVSKHISQGENPHTHGQTDLQRTFFKTIHPSSSQHQLFSMALLNVNSQGYMYSTHACMQFAETHGQQKH